VNTLPVEPAHRLAAQPEAQRWLVTDLWSEGAVGIVGGEPKCCKSFLALELAVAVASGRPALRRFAVTSPGRVLLYAAEDAQHIVRARLEGICAAVACELAAIDVQVITAPTLRLDLERDRERLERTVEALRSRLLILDPFVRLHRIDENSSGEVAPLLAYLRELQRRHTLAVLLVHHARKSSGHVATCAPVKRCAAPPSSTPGATRTCICVARSPGTAATTPVESLGALFARFPSHRSLPRFVAGSASTSALARPARRSLTAAVCVLAKSPT